MSKSSALPLVDVSDPLACCRPLAHEPLGADEAAQVAPLLKALGDPVRLRLVSLVLAQGDDGACVCDLNDAFELSQPTVSHHLKVLHEHGLLEREKRGVWVYYRARREAMRALVSLFDTVSA